MLNYLWGFMILIGIVVASFTGNLGSLTSAVIDSAKDAVALCITMLGIVSMWTGLMKIAERSNLLTTLSRKMRPFLKFLFPRLKESSPAMDYISTNVCANMLGLGWAATPAGIKAMTELQKVNKDKTRASNEMCTFLIFNLSSLQIMSVNIIAYRAQYSSHNPSEIIGPGLLATLVTTLIGIAFAKIMDWWCRE